MRRDTIRMRQRDPEIAHLYDGDDGLSLKQIAEYLGCCIETVRKSLIRQRIPIKPVGLNRRFLSSRNTHYPQDDFSAVPSRVSVGSIHER